MMKGSDAGGPAQRVPRPVLDMRGLRWRPSIGDTRSYAIGVKTVGSRRKLMLRAGPGEHGCRFLGRGSIPIDH
jgi:hypothetical protein